VTLIIQLSVNLSKLSLLIGFGSSFFMFVHMARGELMTGVQKYKNDDEKWNKWTREV
jgi:hypothetical protein